MRLKKRHLPTRHMVQACLIRFSLRLSIAATHALFAFPSCSGAISAMQRSRGSPFAFALSCKIPVRIAKESSGYAGR